MLKRDSLEDTTTLCNIGRLCESGIKKRLLRRYDDSVYNSSTARVLLILLSYLPTCTWSFHMWHLHDEPLSVLEQAMRSFRSSVVLQTKCNFSREKSEEGENSDVFLLQRWSPKWECFVDVGDVQDLLDGDRLTAVPMPPPQSSSSLPASQVGLYVINNKFFH